jgi:hypothetical protein
VKGRCDPCDTNWDAARDAERHTLGCAKWAAAYQADPGAVLDPGPAYERWEAEVQPGLKAADLARRVADTADRRARMADRFRREDLLA